MEKSEIPNQTQKKLYKEFFLTWQTRDDVFSRMHPPLKKEDLEKEKINLEEKLKSLKDGIEKRGIQKRFQRLEELLRTFELEDSYNEEKDKVKRKKIRSVLRGKREKLKIGPYHTRSRPGHLYRELKKMVKMGYIEPGEDGFFRSTLKPFWDSLDIAEAISENVAESFTEERLQQYEESRKKKKYLDKKKDFKNFVENVFDFPEIRRLVIADKVDTSIENALLEIMPTFLFPYDDELKKRFADVYDSPELTKENLDKLTMIYVKKNPKKDIASLRLFILDLLIHINARKNNEREMVIVNYLQFFEAHRDFLVHSGRLALSSFSLKRIMEEIDIVKTNEKCKTETELRNELVRQISRHWSGF